MLRETSIASDSVHPGGIPYGYLVVNISVRLGEHAFVALQETGDDADRRNVESVGAREMAVGICVESCERAGRE